MSQARSAESTRSNAAALQVGKIGDQLLSVGIGVVARAGSGTEGSSGYFVDGHRGAAIIAATLLSEQLSQTATERLNCLVSDQLVDALPAGMTQPFPQHETPDPELLAEVLTALEDSMDELREVGHNVIVGTLALRAFQISPVLLTPSRASGVAMTLRSFAPWPPLDDGNGVLRGDLEADALALGPEFAGENGPEFAALVLREYLHAVTLWSQKGQGWTGHMLTYGNAVMDLQRLGHLHLFEKSKAAFRQYCAITRRGPAVDADDYPEPQGYRYAHLSPTDTEYWERRTSLDIGHGVKYPYALVALLDDIDDDQLRSECLASWWRLSPLPVSPAAL